MTDPRESPPDRPGFAEEYPFESHFLPVAGGRLHYVDEGQGEVLLCVHGNPTWSFAWRNVIRRFRDRYRVIALDHLGCGFSDKPQSYSYRLADHMANLQALIDHLQLRQITLVAHDWGGAIGMGVAGRRPDLFSRLILMNTGAFRSQAIPFRIAVCRWPLLGPLGVRGFNLFARAALSMAMEHPEKLTPAIRRGLLAPYGNWHDRVAIQRFVEDIPLQPSHPSYATLVEVETGLQRLQGHPLLLIWGERDWCFTPAFREEFQRRFPQAEALPLPHAGHYVFEDALPDVLKGMEGFLAQHPAARA
ncbi:MAG: alpha/beta fold hydrolase [Planctomycetaceae bacterium]|jgi:haloalkane dehalogenase